MQFQMNERHINVDTRTNPVYGVQSLIAFDIRGKKCFRFLILFIYCDYSSKVELL